MTDTKTHPQPDTSAPQHSRGLNPTQRDYLLRPLERYRVQHANGQSHLAAWDVRRWLTRIFGIGGWSDEIIDCALVRELESGGNGNSRPRYTVVYRVLLRLRIRDPYGNELAVFEDGATGDAINQPSLGDAHDRALKSALSQALKRTAVNLGDQFGLSLYNGGGTLAENGTTLKPVVQATLDYMPKAPATDEPVRDEQEPQAVTA